jgi:hypothetical protein
MIGMGVEKAFMSHLLKGDRNIEGSKKSHSHTKIQKGATMYQNLLFHICMKLNMFRATHRPSSGA